MTIRTETQRLVSKERRRQRNARYAVKQRKKIRNDPEQKKAIRQAKAAKLKEAKRIAELQAQRDYLAIVEARLQTIPTLTIAIE